MIEQLSVAVIFRAFFVASKVGKTGLSPTVDVYNPAGTQIVTGAAATTIGGGLYSYTLAGASTGTEGEYVAIFKTTDATVDQQHLPVLWVVGRAGVEDLDAAITSRSTYAGGAVASVTGAVGSVASYGTLVADVAAAVWGTVSRTLTGGTITAANVWEYLSASATTVGSVGKRIVDYLDAAVSAVKAKTDLIGAGQITTLAPVATSGAVTLVRGDDYRNADGRALEWTDASAAWPDLTAATIAFRVAGQTIAGTVVTPTGPGKVRVELTAAQTILMPIGGLHFDVIATLSDSHVVTLVHGTCTVGI